MIFKCNLKVKSEVDGYPYSDPNFSILLLCNAETEPLGNSLYIYLSNKKSIFLMTNCCKKYWIDRSFIDAMRRPMYEDLVEKQNEHLWTKGEVLNKSSHGCLGALVNVIMNTFKTSIRAWNTFNKLTIVPAFATGLEGSGVVRHRTSKFDYNKEIKGFGHVKILQDVMYCIGYNTWIV